MTALPITCWYRITERDVEFNHISDGYDPHARKPQPNCEYQKIAWRGIHWEKRAARLVDGVVVEEFLEQRSSGPVRWS